MNHPSIRGASNSARGKGEVFSPLKKMSVPYLRAGFLESPDHAAKHTMATSASVTPLKTQFDLNSGVTSTPFLNP